MFDCQPIIKKQPPANLSPRDDDDLAWFFEAGADLCQRSPLGYQLDCMRDEVGAQRGLPSSEPSWQVDFHRFTDSARAQRVWQRIQLSRERYWMAPIVLSQYYHPTAIAFQGDRLLALYPLTQAAAAGLIVEVKGKGGQCCLYPRPRAIPRAESVRDSLHHLAIAERGSKAPYKPIRKEAAELLTRTAEAYRAAR